MTDAITAALSEVADVLRDAPTVLPWVVHSEAPSFTDFPCIVVQVDTVSPEGGSLRLLRVDASAWMVGHELGDRSAEQAFRLDALTAMAAVAEFSPADAGAVRSMRAVQLSDFIELETVASSALQARAAVRLEIELLVLNEHD